MSHFLYQLRRVKFIEIVQAWKLPIALIASLFYRIRHKDLWIVCEDRNEARDNGYWFYKYVIENHPSQECVYAISKKSPDFDKIVKLGPWVEYGSLKHWVLYFTSTKKISSQKAGNPNAAIFYFLEVYGIIKNKRVFLQHGITKDNAKWLYYDSTKMNRFICGAYPEFEYIKQTFGYPEENVCYTGFCRFDGLFDYDTDKKLVLIMPTWREWIADEDYRLEKFEGTSIIQDTRFFKSWIDFLCDERLKEYSVKYGVIFVFFPHRNMQKYIDYLPKSNEYIKILNANDCGVQDLLKKAALMVTDYSSVFFDMIYMKKPVVFYQFDYDVYRQAQYGEGYFDYNNNPFSLAVRDKDRVFELIECYIKNNYSVSSSYMKAHSDYFRLYDINNCGRVYEVVREL